MLTFKKLYEATADVMKTLKQPIVEKRNKRAVEAAIDSAVEQKMTAEEDLEKVIGVVTDGQVIDINKVLALRKTIKAAEATEKELTEFKAEFFS